MARTNWQDPGSNEIISPHISGLQEAVGKVEESIGLPTITETGMLLTEVFISNDDRYRIFQAPLGKRNWVLSPTPVIKKNGTVINEDFLVDYGGGAVIFTNPITGSDVLTADATYTIKVSGKRLSTEDFTTESKNNLDYVHDNIYVTKSPIGFPNRSDSIFSFNKSTRIFTIQPTGASYSVYFKNNKYTKTAAETIEIPLVTGLHYIFFDEYGTLTTSQIFPGLQNMIYISYIYCNADTGQFFCMGDERHGTVMDKATHERLHSIDWTQWVNGLQVYDYELNNPNGDNAVKISITNGTVADEDLNHYIQHSASPTNFFEQFLLTFAKLPVIYRSGNSGIWNQDTAAEFPFKNTANGRINFNEYDGTTWKQTQALSGTFIAYYVIFAGDVNEPIKVVQGQRYDSTLQEAQANNDDRNILWGSQPFEEFKVLYRLIYQTSDSYTNARKAQLVDVLDLRAARRSPGGGGIIPSAHSNLTGLDYANSGHTGFASAEQIDSLTPYNNPGSHNSIYRGKYLGSSVAAAQYAAISAGTFEDLYIGDYWTMGGKNYRIAAFDYFYNTGDIALAKHHVTLVPDSNLYLHVMNDTNITVGGYIGSKMYTEGLGQAKSTIESIFGSHLVNHKQLLSNAVTDGKASGWIWVNSDVELMNEVMVYGSAAFGVSAIGGNGYNMGVAKSQLPLFTFRPDLIGVRASYWLRDVASATYFASVGSDGTASYSYASNSRGVRPAFSIS